MPEHSPSPWTYVPLLSASENHKGFRIYDVGEFFVADISPRDSDGTEGGANARLIAAAPDLLAALEEVVDRAGSSAGFHIACEKARAAIEQAQGEKP